MANYKPFNLGAEIGPISNTLGGNIDRPQEKGILWIPSSPLDPGHWWLDPDSGGLHADQGLEGGLGWGKSPTRLTGGIGGDWSGGYTGPGNTGNTVEIGVGQNQTGGALPPPQRNTKDMYNCSEYQRGLINDAFEKLFHGEVAERLKKINLGLWNCIVNTWNNSIKSILCSGSAPDSKEIGLESMFIDPEKTKSPETRAFSMLTDMLIKLSRDENPCTRGGFNDWELEILANNPLEKDTITFSPCDVELYGYGNSGYFLYDPKTGFVYANPYNHVPSPEEWEHLKNHPELYKIYANQTLKCV